MRAQNLMIGRCSLVLLVWGGCLIPVKERERVSGEVSNQRFVNPCLANSPSVYKHSYTHLITLFITSSALNECPLVHNFQNNCSTGCHWWHVTQIGPFGIFCLYVMILTISYLRRKQQKRHHYLPIPRGPMFKQIEIFSGILTVYFNCKYFP